MRIPRRQQRTELRLTLLSQFEQADLRNTRSDGTTEQWVMGNHGSRHASSHDFNC